MCNRERPDQVPEKVDKDWIEQHQDGKCHNCGIAFGEPTHRLSEQSEHMPFLCVGCGQKHKGGY